MIHSAIRPLLLAALLLAPLGCTEKPRPPAKLPPNLVLISMDTLRADHLGSYGYGRPTSPSIDALASRGTLFESASSTSSWTPPAHASVFTGRYPSDVGILKISNDNRASTLSQSEITLAEVLKKAGYETQAYTGGGYLSGKIGFDQGFDAYRDRHDLQDYLGEVTGWLDERAAEKPFFLFLHFYNTHRPYLPPGKYKDLFKGDYAGNYNMGRFCSSGVRPSPVDLEFARSQYDGEIAHADALLGTFFQALEKSPAGKDTLIVFLSDHGDEFYEHGRCDHSRTVFQEMVHVPLIITGPKIAKGRVKENVSLIDLPRTILDYLGLPIPAPMRGRSLLPVIAGEAGKEPVFFETQGFGKAPVAEGVRFEDWKLIFEGGRRVVGLYDLAADPTEQNNLLRDPATKERRRILTGQHAAWRAAIEADEPVAPNKQTVSPEVEERLRALGYIE